MAFVCSHYVVLVAYAVLFVIGVVIKVKALRSPATRNFFGLAELIPLASGLITIGLPVLWIATSVLSLADYDTHFVPVALGGLAYTYALCLLGRVAVSLGRFWSPTLQLKEDHQLITSGVYRNIRHPMYLALLVFAVGNALALPNYIAGPPTLISVAAVIAFRVGPEERMLAKEFGIEFEQYRRQSHCIIPGLW